MPKDSPRTLERDVGEIAFGLDAEGYHAGRLPYPDELYDELFERLPPKPAILEIGAGTGLVTQALLSRDVSAVTAVEPNPSLAAFTRRRLENRRLKVIRATFPDPSIDGQFDLIACAAAFHWLERDKALARVKQMLMPKGLWAMWWHSYRNPGQGDELADQISPLLKGMALPPSDTIDQHYSLNEAMHRRVLTAAGFTDVEFRLYRTQRQLTTEAAVALYKSYSFIRLLPSDERARFLDKLADLVDTRFGGCAPNLVLTPLYFANR